MTTRDGLAARFGARLLPPVSDAIVRRWGTISGTMRRDTGHPPPVIDTLLAATALDPDLYLATGTCAMCATVAPPSLTRGGQPLRVPGHSQAKTSAGAPGLTPIVRLSRPL